MGWRYLRWTVNISALLCLTVNNFFRLTDTWRKKQFFLKKLKRFCHGTRLLRTLQNGNKKGWNAGSISHETRPRQGKKILTSNITWLNPQAGKMKRILCSDWLPERARWAQLTYSGFPAFVPQEQVSYWPRSFGKDGWILVSFTFALLLTSNSFRFTKKAKKKIGQ